MGWMLAAMMALQAPIAIVHEAQAATYVMDARIDPDIRTALRDLRRARVVRSQAVVERFDFADCVAAGSDYVPVPIACAQSRIRPVAREGRAVAIVAAPDPRQPRFRRVQCVGPDSTGSLSAPHGETGRAAAADLRARLATCIAAAAPGAVRSHAPSERAARVRTAADARVDVWGRPETFGHSNHVDADCRDFARSYGRSGAWGAWHGRIDRLAWRVSAPPAPVAPVAGAEPAGAMLAFYCADGSACMSQRPGLYTPAAAAGRPIASFQLSFMTRADAETLVARLDRLRATCRGRSAG